MMNTVNVSAANMSQAIPSSTAIIKAGNQVTTLLPSNQAAQQPSISLPQGIIPAIMSSALNNNTNSTIGSIHSEPSATITNSSVNAFTILNPAHSSQSLQATIANNFVNMQAGNAVSASSIIASVCNSGTPPVIKTTVGPLMNVASVQQMSIPMGQGVGSNVSVLKPVTAGLQINQRFQTPHVMMTTSGPAPISAVTFIPTPAPQAHPPPQHRVPSQPLQASEHMTAAASVASKNQSVTHSVGHIHHATHLQQHQQSAVLNAVSVAGPNVHQPHPPNHNPSLFIQASNTSVTNASAILHSNVNIVPPNASVAAVAAAAAAASSTAHQQQQPAPPPQPASNLSTINLTTSTAHQLQPTSTTHPPHQPTNQQQNTQFQRLKVEDALSYLDQVKYKFNDQPQVYNDFLDIMKEFKSQSIDTPGVIQRVSSLFRGHSELIVGFNTFLPPGYKIEMNMNEMNVSMPDAQYTVLMTANTSAPLQHITYSHAPVSTVTPTIGSVSNAVHQISGNLPRNQLLSHSSNMNSHPVPLLPAAHPPGSSSFSNALHASREHNHVQSSAAFHVNNLTHAAALNQPRSDSSINSAALPVHINQRTSHAMDINSNMTLQVQPGLNDIDAQPNSQPVEFNHAISYVNKIKNRFSNQPEVYKQFLDILQSYQKEQQGKTPQITGHKMLTESEVYAQVAKLFQNQEDLLEEFSQFLPDSSGGNASHSNASLLNVSNQHSTLLASNALHSVHNNHPQSHIDNAIGAAYANSISSTDHNSMPKMKSGANSGPVNLINAAASHRTLSTSSSNTFSHSRGLKRTSISISAPMEPQSSQYMPPKRSKLIPNRDNSMAEASKYMGELSEYAFFDKMRHALPSTTQYENFLRCLQLYNNEIISRSELLQLVVPTFSRIPDLLKRFKEMICITGPNNSAPHGGYLRNFSYNQSSGSIFGTNLEGLGGRMIRDHSASMADTEIDLNSGKRLGISYRAVVKPPQECSGRTDLCREVLNDTLVSFPSWSEDSTFVTSRKTPYQDQLHQAEDERFELDLVIENNLSTLRVLEALQKKIERMSPEEKANFKLDDRLGTNSKVLAQASIRRIYGDRAVHVIESLKNDPVNSVPLVLVRLQSKYIEWNNTQHNFNEHWRELNEKCYLKSLDHQCVTFKQNDSKFMKPKALFAEIEEVSRQRKEPRANEQTYQTFSHPHMVHIYPDKAMIEVASNLIIHHVKRLTGTQKEDKVKIKLLLRHFIPDLLDTPRGVLSDGDEDVEESGSEITNQLKKSIPPVSEARINGGSSSAMLHSKPDEEYSLFFINDNWYYFFRLHYLLCDRLSKLNQQAIKIAKEQAIEGIEPKKSIADKLEMKTYLNECETSMYFNSLLDMVTQVMDGNIDSTHYEDSLREIFGIHAYIAFTLDKVVQNIVRQLQIIVSDEEGTQCMDMYVEARKNDGAGGLCLTSHQRFLKESEYYKNAEQALSEDNFFKLLIYKNEGKISFELLQSPEDESRDGSSNENDEDESNQSSRMLRSSARNQSDTKLSKVQRKLTQLAEASLKVHPRFLEGKKRFTDLVVKPKSNDPSKTDTKEDKSSEESEDKLTNEKDEDNAETVPEEGCGFLACLKKAKFTYYSLDSEYKVSFVCKQFKQGTKTHKKVTQKKFSKYLKWYSDWTKVNVLPKTDERFKTWMLLSDTTEFKLEDSDLNNNKKESTIATSTTSSGDLNDKPSIMSTSSADNEGLIKIEDDSSASQKESSVSTESAASQAKAQTTKRLLLDLKIKQVEIASDDAKTPYRTYYKYLREQL